MPSTTLEVEYLEATQNVGTFYSCKLPAQTLLEICRFDFRRIQQNGGKKEFLGIQRPLNDSRVREIRKYIDTEDACFPTSIVISVDERCASMGEAKGRKVLILKPYEDPEDHSQVIPFTGIATIIDGQHRLKAFEGSSQNWCLTVNIFVGADEGTQAMIFSTVNLAQSKVNKSIVYDLFSLDRGRSPEKTCHEIVVNLNSIPESPFYESIKRLGSATEGVFGETLSQATVVKGILPFISNDPLIDRDIGRRIGEWPNRGQKDFQKRIFYPFFKENEDYKILAILINFFDAIQATWPTAWSSTGRGTILKRTNGYNGSIRFLRDAYLSVTTKPNVVTRDDFLAIFARSELKDIDFNTDRFPPGSSGASALYKALLPTLR